MALIMKNAGQKKRPLTVVKATGGELPNILLVDSNLADASQMRQWLEKGAQASLDHASDTAAATRIDNAGSGVGR